MATYIADLIERTAATYSLVDLSLNFRGSEASTPEYLWSCSAQWPSDGEGGYNGRGVVSDYGADPVAAVLNCARLIAIKQDGPLPVRVALRVAT